MSDPNTTCSKQSQSSTEVIPIEARPVREAYGERTPSPHFGKYFGDFCLSVTDFMQELASDYRPGSCWQYYSLSNGGFYIAPEGGPQRFRLKNKDDELLSADAAGIAVSLIACRSVSSYVASELFAQRFDQLKAFALQHAEAAKILAALD